MTDADMDMANAMLGTGMVTGALMQQGVLVEMVMAADGVTCTNQLVVRFPDMPSYGMAERGYLLTVTIPVEDM